MMQQSELVQIMQSVERILLLNKAAISLSVIDGASKMIDDFKGVFGIDADNFLDAIEKVLDIEKELLQHNDGESCLSDKIHNALSNIQQRPLIMMAISSAI